MKVELTPEANEKLMLTVTPESGVEQIALRLWYDKFKEENPDYLSAKSVTAILLIANYKV